MDRAQLRETIRSLQQRQEQRDRRQLHSPAEAEAREDLRLALEQLQAIEDESRTKDAFHTFFSQELRDALSPLRNSLHLVRLHGVSGGTAQALDAVERRFRHLARLVDDFLDLAHLRDGRLALNPERVLLADVVQSALQTARLFLDGSRHRLEVSMPPESVTLVADLARLTRVVVHLLLHAARCTEPGRGIAVRAECVGDEAILSVRDTGAGAHPHLLSSLLDSPEGDPCRGPDIGLALARTIVEMHEGRIEVPCTDDVPGTELIVRLPLQSSLVVLPQNHVLPVESGRVLVVDDNRDAAESLAVLIRLWGYTVDVALDGPSAVASVPVHRPKLVLLDLGLPGMDGYQVALRIREQCGMEEPPVFVAVTGYGRASDVRRSLEAGFHGHLLKPVDAAELLSFLARYVPRAR
jgi:CheY-like chemotaxis protein